MLVQKINQVTEQCRELPIRNPIDFYLFHASKIWCNQLDIPQDITNYILQGYSQRNEIRELTTYIYQKWKEEKKEEEKNWLGHVVKITLKRSRLYSFVKAILNGINVRSEDMNIIVIIAFGITAVGYFIYKLNQQETQRPIPREGHKQYPFNPPPPPTEIITKYLLVLVISASQADFLDSLRNKSAIDTNDGEKLYKLTNYLWIGSENVINQKVTKINNYLVSIGNESEYDINLVYLKLKQSDEGFKPNVNQLDRYDAFCKLSDLVVNFEISPRLRMEAYENLEVYNR